jgi:N-methylhydantoinase B
MERPFDPILVEVIRNQIAAITEEMTLTVYRTGRSGMCKVGDFATAVCDRQGRLVGEGGSPYQMCVFIDTMENVLAKHGGALKPGDIIIANDPYCGISHMPDITLIAPAFWNGQLAGFLISYSHHTDIGGRFAGGISSLCQSSFEEGVRIPMLKLYDAGTRNDALLEVIVANVRTPEEWVGDVDAKVASCWKGQEQLKKLLDKYGMEKFNATCDYLVDYAERATRAAIRQIPSGEYREEMLFEDENEVTGGPVPLEVVVRIDGDHATVDLSASPPQVNASINAPLVSTKAVTRAPFKAIVPGDAITNIGFARAIDIIVPPGTLLNPRYPAAVGGRASLMMTLSNMVFRVIAKALPGRLGGVGEGADMLHFTCHNDGRYLSFMDVFFGGWGGRPHVDGVDGASPMVMGGGYGSMPAELLEREYPVIIEGFGFVPDTEGAGRHRGSVSVYREWRFRQPAEVLLRTVGLRGAEGLAGGRRGGDAVNIHRSGERETVLTPQAHVHLQVEPGDRVYHKVHGSGGYGDSCERDPELVVLDVSEGKISVERAREVYGVVIHPESLTLDREGTLALRYRLKNTLAAAAD